jgi:hypothetical protein
MFKATRLFSFRISKKSNGRIRFTALGFSGFIALRKIKSRGYGVQRQSTFTQLHLGRISIALEHNRPAKQVWNFAG